MSDLNFTVSYINSQGNKEDKEIFLNSEEYKKGYEKEYSYLMQNYPPDQVENHILPTKKTYIQHTIEDQFTEGTKVKYDIAEMITALDKEVKGI